MLLVSTCVSILQLSCERVELAIYHVCLSRVYAKEPLHFLLSFFCFSLPIKVNNFNALNRYFTSPFRTISTFLHDFCNVHTLIILPHQTEVPFLSLPYF